MPLNELLLKLNAEGNSSEQAAAEVSAVMPRIMAWCDRLSAAQAV